MTKRTFLFSSMFATMLTVGNVNMMAEPVDLSVSIIDPKESQTGQQRSPVSIPEIDLDAVLDYTQTDDLYFYAGPDGTVYYAKDGAGHQKNVEAHPWPAKNQE